MNRYDLTTDELYFRSRVRQLLDYNPDTGSITWRIARQGGYAIPGERAGSFNDTGHSRICIDGKNHSSARLAWLLKLGYFPDHRICFSDGNPKNLRWDNIKHERENLSGTRIATYHRSMRSINKEIAQRVASSDSAMRDAFAAGGRDARSIRAYWRNIIRQEMAEAGINPMPHDDKPPKEDKRFGTSATRRTRKRKPL